MNFIKRFRKVNKRGFTVYVEVTYVANRPDIDLKKIISAPVKFWVLLTFETNFVWV
jgi:hypothetical protein